MPRKLNTEIKRMMEEYPMLFGTRIAALHHLFCVLGNGYHWEENGILVYSPRLRETPKQKEARRKESERSYNETRKRFLELGVKIPTYKQSQKENLEEAKQPITRCYPFEFPDKFGHVNNIPNNIPSDWLAGIRETMKWAVTAEPLSKDTVDQRPSAQRVLDDLDKRFGVEK